MESPPHTAGFSDLIMSAAELCRAHGSTLFAGLIPLSSSHMASREEKEGNILIHEEPSELSLAHQVLLNVRKVVINPKIQLMIIFPTYL